MITRRNYIVLAVVTLVLFVVGGAIGEGRDVLWIVDDITFFGFIACALLLVAMTVAILVRSLMRRSDGTAQ
jgi:hypothetical protein